MSRTQSILPLAALPVVLSLGCGVLERAASIGATSAAPTGAAASPTARPAIRDVTIETPSELNQAAADLSGLRSYQATLRLQVEGEQDGSPVRQAYRVVRWVASDPALQVSFVEASGRGEGRDRRGTYVIVSARLALSRLSPDEACVVIDPTEAAALLIAPATLLPDLGEARPAETGTIDGVPAQRYTLSGGSAGAQGDAWFSQEGGYALRATLEQEGLLTRLGAGLSGRAVWEYELSSVDDPVSPEIPLSCQRLLGDLPIPNDATGLSATDDVVSLTTSMSPTEVVSFYTTALAEAGWEPMEGSGGDPLRQSADFRRGEAIASVFASAADTATGVVVVFDEFPQGTDLGIFP